MQADKTKRITIAGAGLAGALLATLLARKGWQVEVFEKRPDPRLKGYEGGRSINLALAERGLHALREAGLNDLVMQQAVMMRGRMVHMKNGDTQLQRYGKDDSEVIWSVHRGALNITLLNAAEAAGASILFNHRIDNIDFDKKSIHLINDVDRRASALDFDVLVGADGAVADQLAGAGAGSGAAERETPDGIGRIGLEIDFAVGADLAVQLH